MSLFQELKVEFENDIGVPVVFNEGGRFSVLGNEAFSISYGSEDGDLPEFPAPTYNDLFQKSYYFKDWTGSDEASFIPHKKTILKYSFDAFADAIERLVLTDVPCDAEALTSLDDITNAVDSFGDYRQNSTLSLNQAMLFRLKENIFKNHVTINGTGTLPFSWNFLDHEIPIFSHNQKSVTKAVVYHKHESIVVSDVEFKIVNKILWLTFRIGLNSKDRIKVFNLT